MNRIRAARASLKPTHSKKAKHYLMITAVVLALGLIIFAEVIRPNQDARAYTGRLDTASKPLNQCFEKLAATTELDIYYAPDVSLDTKQKNITTIKSQIAACREELASFDAQAHRLLTLHFAGFTQTYRDAQVNQRQAYDVIGQSRDVLNQYYELADFLDQYYNHIAAFMTYFANLQKIENNYGTPNTATVKILSQQAGDLHKRAGLIRGLKVTPGFELTKTATADMFEPLATGFDNAVKGYTNYSDYYTNLGLGQVDKAVADYDAKVINMPFDQLKTSYIPKQVQQLPIKIQNLLAAQSE